MQIKTQELNFNNEIHRSPKRIASNDTKTIMFTNKCTKSPSKERLKGQDNLNPLFSF